MNDRQSEMAAETGYTYISETVKGKLIPTTYMGYNTMCRWKIDLASKYNSDRQPEISIWPPKPEIITSLELWQIASKFQHQIPDFRWCRARQKISQVVATMIHYQKLHDWRAKYIAISGCRSLSQSSGVSFFRTGRGRIPQIFRWNCHPLSSFQRYKYFRFWRPHCYFELLVVVAITGRRPLGAVRHWTNEPSELSHSQWLDNDEGWQHRKHCPGYCYY